MLTQMAHKIEEKDRTEDIHIKENIDFTSMLLSDIVLQGLKNSGFKKPSPIQLKAIPMGRCGYDLIIKAKSGTGKTAVFGIIALEMVNVKKNTLQVIILAPTREIAVQIQQAILTIGSNIEGLQVEYFIGGTSVAEDIKKIKQCHIAVGAPGRMKHLVKEEAVTLDNVRLFILDEADKLMLNSFQKDINKIYNKLPEIKQVIASSATYPNELDIFLSKYMTSPVHINPDTEMPVLLGLKQFVSVVKSHLNVLQQIKIKTEELIRILSNTSFTQCMVFSNYQIRAESLSIHLIKHGWPSAFISAAQNQEKRLKVVNDLKEFKCRILLTTDLTARGIDAANVDLVINIDVPYDTETYLHRMGRAGRYGSRGICITIAADGKDVENLQVILGNIGGDSYSIAHYPKNESPLNNIWECDIKTLEQFYGKKNPDKSDSSLETNTSEMVCKELKDLSVKEHNEEKSAQLDKENIVNKTISQLVNISQEPGNNLESNSDEMESCIEMLLQNFSKEDETEKNELKDKYNSFNPDTITEHLSKPGSSMTENIPEEETTIKRSKNKKIKPNEISDSPVSKNILSDSHKITHDKNKQFNNEAKLFQENIYNKNISLYNITKYLFEQEETVNDEYENSINKLLNIIKEEEDTETSQSKENCSFEDKLQLSSHDDQNCTSSGNANVRDSQPEDNIEKQNNLTSTETNDIESCECSENIFINAYDFAVSKTQNHWQKSICKLHSQDDNTRVNITGNDSSIVEDYYNYDYTLFNESEYYDSDNLQQNIPEFDEDIFVKAYDYAIQNHTDENYSLFVNKTENNETEDELSNEAFGYAASFSYPLVTSREISFKESNKSNNKRKRYKTENRRAIYETKFNYYADILSENAPYFTDVQEFDAYFAEWKRNVCALRHIIHEDVYTNELTKYKSNY